MTKPSFFYGASATDKLLSLVITPLFPLLLGIVVIAIAGISSCFMRPRAGAVTVETRVPYTAGHQREVADLSRAIAMELKPTSDRIDGIQMAAMVHDLGKISVPADILSKPTKLTKIEFELIKTHPQCGYDILKNIDFPWPIARMILEHHERMDGSGYPRNLRGDDILLESRILAVADVIESMASHRPYRPALGLNAALEEIEKNRGIIYDADAADACLRVNSGKTVSIWKNLS